MADPRAVECCREDRARLAVVVVVTAVVHWGCPPEKPSDRAESAPSSRGASQEREKSGRRSPGERRVVASVNGEPMTLRELEGIVELLPEYARARARAGLDSEGKREAYLRSLAQFQIMADVAERRGLGGAPEVVDAMKRTVAEETLRAAARDRASVGAIDGAAVEEYYRAHSAQFRRPERRAALVMAFHSRERARSVRGELAATKGAVEARIRRFRQRASRGSVDPDSARRGGAIGWVEPPEYERDHPTVASVVFGLDEPGAISDLFEVGDRWYIATWRERRPATQRSLEQASADIRSTIRQRRLDRAREQLREEWREQASIELRQRVLEELEAPEPRRRTTDDEIPLRTVTRDGVE